MAEVEAGDGNPSSLATLHRLVQELARPPPPPPPTRCLSLLLSAPPTRVPPSSQVWVLDEVLRAWTAGRWGGGGAMW